MRIRSLLLVSLAAAGCTAPPPRVASSEVRVDTPPASAVDTALTETQRARWKEASRCTNTSKETLLAAANAENIPAAEPFLTSAVTGYRRATHAWEEVLEAGGSPRRRYDARFWLADAWNKLVRTTAALHTFAPSKYPEPLPEDVQRALATALAACDVTDANDYVADASQFVVLAADVAVNLEYARYAASGGTLGFSRRTSVEMEGPAGAETVKVVPIPAAVQVALDARDQYAKRVPAAMDTADARGTKTATLHQFDAAMTYYHHGHLAEARSRFDAVYQSACAINEYGFRAWQSLVEIAVKSRDPIEAKRLADAEAHHSCAMPSGY